MAALSDDVKLAGTAIAGAAPQVAYHGPDIISINPYQFVREADNGSGGFANNEYLIPHTRERMLAERKQYSYYPNFFKRIINALVDPVYREEPKRNEATGNELFAKFMTNCNRRGTPWARWIRSVARKVRRYGVGFVVVDNDAKPAPTLAEAVAKDQRPYVYFVSPERVVSYQYDNMGALTELRFYEDRRVGGEKEKFQRSITAAGWFLYKKVKDEWVQDSSGAYTIGVIPVVPIYDDLPEDEEDPILSLPPLYHIARLNHAIMNICSEMREQERGQMFSLLKLPKPAGSVIPSALTIGIGNAITYDPKDGGDPGFIGPDPAILEAVMKDRDFLIQQMFEMASVLGVSSKQNKDSSGWKVEVQFQSSNQNLITFTSVMESAEVSVVDIVDLFLRANLEFTVEYSDNFGLINDMSEITQMQESLAVAELPAKVRKAVVKDWVGSRFRSLPPDELQELLDAVDQNAIDEQHTETIPVAA